MSRKNFLKPFALTVSALLASTQADAAADPQFANAVEQVTRASAETDMADLTLAVSTNVMTADAQHASHSSHSSHASHSSHSSHSSSSY